MEVFSPQLTLSESDRLVSESRSLLMSASPPVRFQVFVKTVSGKTITLNDVEDTTGIDAIMGMIEDRDGIPAAEQRLVHQGKELSASKKVSDYGIQSESTLYSLLRLRGGLGERATMEYTIGREIRRGNLKNEIAATSGASAALKNWGRAKVRDESFWRKIWKAISKDVAPMDYATWKKKNFTHVYAMIQETTHGGNCGDFSQVVHSRLVSSTKGQWVYQIVMHGTWPDEYQYDEEHGRSSHGYDHQLCLTYPTEVGSLAEMDTKVATIADGWDNYKVCTLQSFIDGNNAYGHKMTWANLKIVKKEACTGDGPPPKLKSAIVAIVGDDLDDYTESASFKKDKKTAMDKVDAGYNFGTRHAPIPDEVDDDRETEDIVRQLDQIGGEDWETFEAEALSLADHQLWNYFAVSEGARDNIFKQLPVRRRLYKLLLEDNDSDFLWAMSHLEDDQFVDFFSHDSGTGAARDRVLSLSRTRQRMFDIFSSAPDGILATQCAWIGPDNFVAYFTSSATARDKVLGSSALRESLYATADKQGKAGFQAIMAHMTDEQLQAFADSTPARMEKCRKIKAIAKRLA
jgi:hypothetical protein